MKYDQAIGRTMGNLNAGDIVNNGFYDIQLTESPHWNDTHNRWFCHGRRWIKSRNEWEAKPKLYGWVKLAAR